MARGMARRMYATRNDELFLFNVCENHGFTLDYRLLRYKCFLDSNFIIYRNYFVRE